jgi:hypothetical protein
MIVLSGVYGLVAVISLTGFVILMIPSSALRHCCSFIGAIRKKESYVGIFLRLIQGFLAVQILLTLANVILYFVDKDEFKKLCIGSSTDQRVIDACNSSSNLTLWTVIVSAVVPVLFSACMLFLPFRFDHDNLIPGMQMVFISCRLTHRNCDQRTRLCLTLAMHGLATRIPTH